MPSRRIFELTILTIILMRPVFGMMHVETRRLLDSQQPGTFLHGVAEVATVVLS